MKISFVEGVVKVRLCNTRVSSFKLHPSNAQTFGCGYNIAHDDMLNKRPSVGDLRRHALEFS